MSAVFHRRIATELEVMPFNLRVMATVGLWGNRKHLYRFVLAFFWATAIILFPKAVLGIGTNRFDAIAKGWAEFFYQCNLIVAVTIFATKRPVFEQMIALLNEIFEQVTDKDQPKHCYEEIRTQNGQIDKFAKFYAIYCSISPFVFCIPPVTTSYLRYFTSGGNDSVKLEFELPMEQTFYGMQIRTNFVHYHIFVLLSVTAYCTCAFLSLIKVSTMIIIMKYCTLMYRLVVIQIRDLTQLPENISKVPKLVNIVRLHNSAFDVTQLAEEILNIPMMMQFMSTMLFWCLTMFYVSTNINVSLFNVMIIVFLSLLETYGYSYLGSQLADEAAAVGSAIYDLPWYEESVQLQNKYRLVLQRSQRETGITAAKFFIVGLEQFGKIAQMSYSYYLVLKDSLARL